MGRATHLRPAARLRDEPFRRLLLAPRKMLERLSSAPSSREPLRGRLSKTWVMFPSNGWASAVDWNNSTLQATAAQIVAMPQALRHELGRVIVAGELGSSSRVRGKLWLSMRWDFLVPNRLLQLP